MAQIRRYDEIMESMISNMAAKQDKLTDFNEGSVIHTLLDTNARIAERLYVAIRQGYNELLSILPTSLFGFERKEGLYASGTVIFSRSKTLSSRTTIPKGVTVSGGGFKFTTTESGAIEADSTDSNEINATAEEAGSEYNIESGTINTIESAVPADVVEVRNDFDFTGGADDETDSQFEERFRDYINGLQGTNCYAIMSAALNVDSVRSVSTQNHKPPLENVYNMSVYVEDGSGGASDETLEKVKNAIEGDGTEANQGHLAPGINVRVLEPTAVPVDFSASVTVTGNQNEDEDSLKSEVEKTVEGYINGLAIGKPVILSEIIALLMGASYVKDVQIKTPTTNIELTVDQIARLGTLEISFVEAD